MGIYLWPVAACPRTRQWVEPGLETAWIRCTPAKLRANELGCRMLSRNNVSGVSSSLPWPSPGATVPNPAVRAGYDALDALSWMGLGLPQYLDYSCPPPGLHITPIQQSGGVRPGKWWKLPFGLLHMCRKPPAWETGPSPMGDARSGVTQLRRCAYGCSGCCPGFGRAERGLKGGSCRGGFLCFCYNQGERIARRKPRAVPRRLTGELRAGYKYSKGGCGDTAKLLSVTPDCNKRHRLRTGAWEARVGCRKGSRCEVLLSWHRDPPSWCTLHPWGF